MPHTTILYAEDNETVSRAVAELLELEGWRIVVCADGLAALAELEGGARYGLLLFDHELPGASGLELTRRARELEHRRGTPILVVSAGDVEAEARRAGADEFLRKPEGIHALAGTVARLLAAFGQQPRHGH